MRDERIFVLFGMEGARNPSSICWWSRLIGEKMPLTFFGPRLHRFGFTQKEDYGFVQGRGSGMCEVVSSCSLLLLLIGKYVVSSISRRKNAAEPLQLVLSVIKWMAGSGLRPFQTRNISTSAGFWSQIPGGFLYLRIS